jgi:hypothetical protein
MFAPELFNFTRQSVNIDTGSGIVNSWTSFETVPEYTNIYGMFHQYRIVSYGLRVFCSASMSESQGTVVLALQRVPSDFTLYSTQYPEFKVFGLNGLDATMIAKSVGPESDNWTDIGANAERFFMYVGVDGAAAEANVLGVEVTMHIELLPRIGLGATLTTRAEPVPRVIKDAQDRVERKIPAIMDGPSEVRSKSMMDYAAEAISWAADHPAEIVAGLSFVGL